MSLYGNDDCIRYFCGHCIQNYSCCQDDQCVAVILDTGDGSYDDEEGDQDYLPRTLKRNIDCISCNDDDYDFSEEVQQDEDELDIIGEKEGSAAKEAWPNILSMKGLDGSAERLALTKVCRQSPQERGE